jgi:secondary thiamine-phosphate synthase enzyme
MKILAIRTGSRTELIDVTGQVQDAVEALGLNDGLVLVYVPHTTAAVTINEGADPAVRQDVLSVLNQIVPWDFGYRHLEGNSPAHIKATLVSSGVQVIVEEGQLRLGTWQRIFFCEFDGPRQRKLWVKALARA